MNHRETASVILSDSNVLNRLDELRTLLQQTAPKHEFGGNEEDMEWWYWLRSMYESLLRVRMNFQGRPE